MAIGTGWVDNSWVDAGWVVGAWSGAVAVVVVSKGAYPAKRIRFKGKYYLMPRDRLLLAKAVQQWVEPEVEPPIPGAEAPEPRPPVSIETEDGVSIAVLDPPRFTKRDLGVLTRRLEDLQFQRAQIDSFLIALKKLREEAEDEEDALIVILMVA